jgi:hypothetical protein
MLLTLMVDRVAVVVGLRVDDGVRPGPVVRTGAIPAAAVRVPIGPMMRSGVPAAIDPGEAWPVEAA